MSSLRFMSRMVLASALISASFLSAADQPVNRTKQPVDRATAEAKFAALPLAFESNQGQADPHVRFLARGAGYTLFLADGEAVLATQGKDGRTEYVRVKLAGASAQAQVAGEEQLGGKTNYFIGNDPKQWHTGITDYGKVRYSSVYPGVDVVYYGNHDRLEHDFIVRPGADAKKITLELSGAKKVTIDARTGDLIVKTSAGEVRLEKPVVYQTIAGKRVEVAGGYTVGKHHRVGFELGGYDKSRELVIDPVLNYGTYLSTAAGTTAVAVATDSSGAIYVTGNTTSAAFPAPSPIAHNLGTAGSGDIYVVKLDPTQNASAQLVYTTFIGGVDPDFATGIAVDAAKDAYIAGYSSCTAGGYPAVNGQTTCAAGGNIGVVSKLDPTGASLLYSTYYGAEILVPNAVAVVASPSAAAQTNVVIAGYTNAAQATSANSFSTTPSGSADDAFIAELNTTPAATISNFACNGTGTATATFTSATPYVVGERVRFTGPVASPAGNNYAVTAFVTSTTGTTATFSDGGCTTLEAPFAAAGSALSQVVYSSLLGGAGGISVINGMAASGPNAIYVTGYTLSGSFPTAGTPVQATLKGTQNAVIARFDPTQAVAANTLVASTYLGGSGVDRANAIALDAGGNVYVAGQTSSTDFFTASAGFATGPQFSNHGGPNDAFVAQLTAGLNIVNAGDYLGGTGNDIATSIAVDSTNSLLWVAGRTTTPTAENIFNFNALQSSLVSTQDGFVAEYDTGIAGYKMTSYLGGGASDQVVGLAVSGAGQVALAATLSAGSPVTTASAYQTSSLTASAAMAGVIISNSATALTSPLSVTGLQTNNVIYTDGGTNVQTTVYTWTVKNNDGVSAASQVKLDLPIPGGVAAPTVTFSGITPTGMSCTIGAGGVTCHASTIAVSGTASVQLTVGLVSPCTAASCTDIIANASVVSADKNSAGSGSITTHRVPVTTLNLVTAAASDVTATKFVQDTDSKITYTYTVKNAGTNPVNNVKVAVTADSTGTVSSTVGTGAACSGTTTTTPSCVINLAAGASFTMTVAASPGPLGASASRAVPNAVTVGSSTSPISFFDVNGVANTAVATAFTQERDTTLTYTVTDNGPVALGAAVKMTGTYGNTGKSNAPTLQTTMTLDAALTGVTYNNDAATDAGSNALSAFATGNCAAAGSVITCNQGALARLTGSTTFSATANAPTDFNLPITLGAGSIACASGGASVTSTAHGFVNGDSIYVYGVDSTGTGTQFNGIFTVANATANTFTYTTTPACLSNGNAGNGGFVRKAAASLTLANTGALNTNPAGQVVNATAMPLSATDAPVAQRQSDLFIVPTTSGGQFIANATTVPLAGPLQYTLVVGNNGPNNAIDVDVRFTLTTGTNITTDAVVNSVTGASYCVVTHSTTTTQAVDCFVNSLNNAATATVVVSLVPPVTQTISAGTTNSDTLSASASVSSVLVVDGVATNNATDGTGNRPAAITGQTIQRRADLDISAAGTTVTFASTTSSGTTTVPLAGTITYTYRIVNNGPDAAKNVLSSIALTPGSTITIAPTVNSNTGATCVYNATGPKLDCTTSSIAASASNDVSVQISIPITSKLDPATATSATDTLGATVALGTQVATFDTTAANNTNTGTSALTLQRTADLDITGAFSGTATTNLTGAVAYTFNVNNLGPDTALKALARIALNPATFATAPTVTGQPTGGNCVINAGNVDCTLASVATGAASYTVTLSPPIPNSMTGASAAATSTLTGNASLQAATLYVDGVSGNDTNATTVSTTLKRQSDLQMNYTGAVFSASTSTVSLAGPLTYTATIKNAGPDPALNVGTRLTLSTGAVTTPFAFVSAVAASAQPVSCVAGATTLDCKFASLNSGSTDTLTINITPPLTSAMNGGAATDAMTTTAKTASASVVDDGTAGAPGANNTSPTTVGTTIERLVDLQVTGVTAVSDVTGSSTFVQDKDATMTYTVAIKNNGGPDAAQTINVTGTVPSNFTSTSAGCTQAGGIGTAVTCNNAVASLAANATTTFQIVGTLAALPAGTASSTSAATFSINSTAVVDSNPANNSGTVNITQERDADVQITSIIAGGNVSDPSLTGSGKFIDTADANIAYKVTLANPSGPSNATNISLNIAVPAGMTLVSGTGCTQSGGAGTAVTCTNALAALNKGATGTFNLTLAPAALSSTVAQKTLTSSITATGGYNDPTPTNNTNINIVVSQERDADVTVTVGAAGDVAAVSNKFIETVDSHLNYSVLLSNVSNSSSGSTVTPTVSVSVPAGMALFSGAGCTQAGGAGTTITCTSPAIATGGVQTVTFATTPSALASATTSQNLATSTTASGAYNDPTPANNTNIGNTVSQERDADVGITSITAAGDVAAQVNKFIENVDTKIVYTVNVANANTATTSTATNINLTVTGIPAGATLVPQAGCTQTAPGANIVCGNAIASLAKGASTAYTVGVMPAPLSASSASTTVTGATGAVAGSYIDPNPANDSLAFPSVTQERDADVSIASIATAGNNSGLTGKFIESVDTQINYVVTLANANTATTSTATSITLTATVPSGTTMGSGACSITGTTLTCTNAVPSLAKNANTAFSFSLVPVALNAATATSAFNISMTAAGAYNDPTPANNTNIPSPVSQERDADVSIAVAAQGNNSALANTFIETVDTQENYAITVSNANTATTSTATNITITATVPSGTTLGTIPASGCAVSGTTLTCTNAVPSLANGATTIFNVSLVPAALAAGTTQQPFAVSVSAAGGYNDPNNANNTNIGNTTSQERDADVAITSIAAVGNNSGVSGKLIASVDTQINYTVSLLNANTATTSTATDITITATLPSGTTLGTIPASGCSVAGTTLTCTNAIAALAKNAATTFSFSLVPSALAANNPSVSFPITVTAAGAYNDSNPANNTNIPNTVSQERDADVTIGTITTVGNNSALANTFVDTQDTALNVTVPLSNSGAVNISAATDLTLTVIVPSGTTLNGSATVNGSPVSCAISGTTLTCTNLIASLAAGASNTVVLPLVPPALGTNSTQPFNLTFSVSGGYIDLNNADNININGPSVTVEREADLAITSIVANRTFARVSNNPARTDLITYTATVQNNGPSNAQSLTVTDVLPANLSFASSASGCTASGQTVTCAIASLANAGTTTVSFVATPNLSTTLATLTVSNTASVASSQSVDPTPGNNSPATAATLDLLGDADVAVTVTPTPASTVNVGQNLSYVVTITNNGPWPAAAGAITVASTVPFTGMAVSAPGFTCNPSGSACVLNSSLGVGSGSAVTITFSGTVPASAVSGLTTPLSETSTASTTIVGSNYTAPTNYTDAATGNNTGTASVTGQAAADLGVTQVSNGPVLFNHTATYTLTVTNTAGLSPALNPQVVNTVTITPANSAAAITGLSAGCSATPISGGTATVTCNLAQINSGTQATASFSLLPTLPGQISNSATVNDGTEPDPVSANNSAAALLTIVDNTPTGTNVSVTPSNSTTGVASTIATMVFANVTTQGTTHFDVLGSGTLPFNYRAGSAPNFYAVNTTAIYSGTLGVCVNYSPTTFQKPERVRLFAANLDITTSLNQTTSMVCGQFPATQLLGTNPVQLGVFEPVNHAPVAAGSASSNASNTGKGGITGSGVLLDSNATTDQDVDPCNGATVASGTTCADKPKLKFVWTSTAFKDFPVHTVDCQNPATWDPTLAVPNCYQLNVSMSVGSNSVTLVAYDQLGAASAPVTIPVSVNGVTAGTGTTTAVSVSAGQAGSFNQLTLSLTNNTAASVTYNLSITGTPDLKAAQITCSISPASVTVAAGQTATPTAQITCSTTAPTFASLVPAVAPSAPQGGLFAAAIVTGAFPLAGLVLMLPGGTRRRRFAKLLLVMGLVLLLSMVLVSCGGGGSAGGAPRLQNAGTPSGTYTLTISDQFGTSYVVQDPITHNTIPLTLTVH